jgi:predicted nucleic acid-binding protein
MSLILDTGPIVALLDADDLFHESCVAMISDAQEELLVPLPVLVEVDYWTIKLLGHEAWRIFLEDLASGAYRLTCPDEKVLQRAAELEEQYSDMDLGLVDASVIALCERLGETKVATLDRRDFSVVRPRHCERLRLLPE